MQKIETVTNRFGDQWTLEHEESGRLTSIDGFLMTWHDLSRITLSSRLNGEDKERARTSLVQRLLETPIGKAITILYMCTDE